MHHETMHGRARGSVRVSVMTRRPGLGGRCAHLLRVSAERRLIALRPPHCACNALSDISFRDVRQISDPSHLARQVMAIFQGGNNAGGMFFPNGAQGWNFRLWASPPAAPRTVSVRGPG